MARIMVIDDEPDLRALLRLMLETYGHEVHEAANGAEGLNALREQAYDLVIADVLMPEQDGVAVAKLLPTVRPEAKILAISGGGPAMPADWSLRMMKMFGVGATLQKPFEEAQLVSAVNRLLAG